MKKYEEYFLSLKFIQFRTSRDHKNKFNECRSRIAELLQEELKLVEHDFLVRNGNVVRDIVPDSTLTEARFVLDHVNRELFAQLQQKHSEMVAAAQFALQPKCSPFENYDEAWFIDTKVGPIMALITDDYKGSICLQCRILVDGVLRGLQTLLPITQSISENEQRFKHTITVIEKNIVKTLLECKSVTDLGKITENSVHEEPVA